MEDHVLKVIAEKHYVPSTARELRQRLRLGPRQEEALLGALRRLEQAGRIARIKGDRYIQPREADLIPGRIRMNRQGKGFLQPDDPKLPEIVIPEQATGTALHEDRVLVRREVKPKGLLEREPSGNTGRVIRILERRRTCLVGTLHQSRQFYYVIPDDPRLPHDVYVPAPAGDQREARPGQKVVVELKEWESRHTNPEGVILEVLGAPDAAGVDMLSILRQYQLPQRFPKTVWQEARAFGTEPAPAEASGREDCRAHAVVTVDPDDAKDFDDAFCLKPAGQNQWRLWVHIADVSHYVKPGSALDEEARQRGNSTYLVDRVLPMLPEALSNELCSLKPGRDRLTKCVEFLISNDGRVQQTRFYPAIIRSQCRFSYQEALAILERKPQNQMERMLHQASTLAQRIRRLRFRAGSLALDFPESKIRLDDQGRVLRIERVVNDISHQMIEEFMLLANEGVAAHLMKQRRPALYRVHEEPDPKRLAEYREEVLSHGVPCGNLSNRGEVQKLLHRLDALPIGPALKIGFLKSLMRARYAVEPLGHYGLAKGRYAHFTSPIRRYADLVVHRALFEPKQRARHPLETTADHLSATERNSADAERDSKEAKLFAFLEAQIRTGKLEAYTGLVIELSNFGFFVDVPDLTLSGLVRLSTIQEDFFVLDPARNHLVGRRSRRLIRVGDQLQVAVARVDRFKRRVDFKVSRLGTEKKRATAPKRTGERQQRSRTTSRGRGRRR